MKNIPEKKGQEENPFKCPQHFITLQYHEFNFDLTFDLYFEITAEQKLIVISRFLPETVYKTKKRSLYSSVYSDCKLELDYDSDLSEEGNLFIGLSNFLEKESCILGMPEVLEFTSFFPETEWGILRNYFNERLENIFGREMIFFFDRLHVNFKPYDTEKGIWTVACPSGGNHHLYINTFKKNFICKHCEEKGHYLDLLDWFEFHKKLDDQRIKKNKQGSNLTYEQLIPPGSDLKEMYTTYWLKTFLTESNFKNFRIKKLKLGYSNSFLPKIFASNVEIDEFIRSEAGRLPFFFGTQFGLIPKMTDEMKDGLEGQLIAVLGKSMLSGHVAGLSICLMFRGERRVICHIRNESIRVFKK